MDVGGEAGHRAGRAAALRRGLLQLDDPVCRHLPEFGVGGKDAVTIRHVLTHTGGFPAVAVQWSDAPWDEILAEICATPLSANWVPGERAAYHIASGWYVLAELIRRRDGREYPRYVREAIFEPLGMHDSWIGMPRDRHRAYGDRIAPMHATELEPIPHPYWPWAGSADACALCRPGGSAWGPARELGRFYEALLAGGAREDARILPPELVALMTARQTRAMLDETFQVPLDRGLGVVIDSKRYGVGSAWFGTHCSEQTYGHGGYRCAIAFADPAHGLAAAVVFNGMPTDEAHAARARAVVDALYRDLGLASREDRLPAGSPPCRVCSKGAARRSRRSIAARSTRHGAEAGYPVALLRQARAGGAGLRNDRVDEIGGEGLARVAGRQLPMNGGWIE